MRTPPVPDPSPTPRPSPAAAPPPVASRTRRRRINPTWLGLFVVLGLALLFVTLFGVAGGSDLLRRKERVVMYFGGSIYGLQVGAPVVFRGVRLGSVTQIGLAQDKASNEVAIPVVAELDRDIIRNIGGSGAADDPSRTLNALVDKGLRAELAMQSLLTNQLYVDLDFQPDRQARRRAIDRSETQIPTVATAIQELRAQIDGVNLRQLLDDVSSIAASARKLVDSPEMARGLKDLATLSTNLRQISDKLDRQVEPLAQAAQDTLADTRVAMRQVGQAAQQAGQSASRVADSVAQAGNALAPGSPLLASLQTAADELARSAAALRQAGQSDSELMQNLQRALQDMARASRAVRDLADQIDEHPESLIRGRP